MQLDNLLEYKSNICSDSRTEYLMKEGDECKSHIERYYFDLKPYYVQLCNKDNCTRKGRKM